MKTLARTPFAPLVGSLTIALTAHAAAADDPAPMPRALELVGLHAYAEKSVAAGQTIHFSTSSTVPYELSICRLGWKVDGRLEMKCWRHLPIDRPCGSRSILVP